MNANKNPELVGYLFIILSLMVFWGYLLSKAIQWCWNLNTISGNILSQVFVIILLIFQGVCVASIFYALKGFFGKP